MDHSPTPRPGRRRLILLMGPRSSGKTSIVDFMFKKTAASDTLFTESTRVPTITDFAAFMDFQIWDLPGNFLDPQAFDINLANVGSVIYVLDGQSFETDTSDLSHKLALSISRIYSHNPSIFFDLFIHKTEGMSEDYRTELWEDICQRLRDDLDDSDETFNDNNSLNNNSINNNNNNNNLLAIPPFSTSSSIPTPTVHFTSTYNPSIYYALSQIIQKLLPCQAPLERLLDSLCQQSDIEKAFLFHVPSKLFASTDSSPVDSKTHEICSNFIDLSVDFGALYSPATATYTYYSSSNPSSSRSSSVSRSATPIPDRSSSYSSSSSRNHPLPPPALSMTTSTELLRNSAITTTTTTPFSLSSNPSPTTNTNTNTTNPTSSSVLRSATKVKLTNGTNIAYWEMSDNLALVALVRPNVIEHQSALLEYNVACFADAVLRVYDLENRHDHGLLSSSSIEPHHLHHNNNNNININNSNNVSISSNTYDTSNSHNKTTNSNNSTLHHNHNNYSTLS